MVATELPWTAPDDAPEQTSLCALVTKRLIAQLHEQAIAAAHNANNDLSIAKDAQRRKAEARLFSVGAFVLALGCIIAVACVLVLWP